jgi:hypothetical protein
VTETIAPFNPFVVLTLTEVFVLSLWIWTMPSDM